MKPTLIIDVSHVFFQLIWAMPELTNAEKEVHIIFGFLNKIISLANKFNTNKFVFCFDSRTSKRKEIYPQYKEKRNKKDKTPEEREMFQLGFSQLHEIRESVLPKLGFKNLFLEEGFEADDSIAKLAMKYGLNKEFIIISSDNDLLQLLDYCKIYDSKSEKLYRREEFISEYGIEPNQWAEVKKIAGCTSDCVEGVPGVGEKTAIKFITMELSQKSVKYKAIENTPQEVFDRNLKLVKLPFEGFPDLKLSISEKFDLKDFVGVCEEYGFRSLLNSKSFDIWKEKFCEGL